MAKRMKPFFKPLHSSVNADLRAAVFIGSYTDTAQGDKKVQRHIAADDETPAESPIRIQRVQVGALENDGQNEKEWR